MISSIDALLQVPHSRRAKLASIVQLARNAKRVVLTTHVNADADGAGSEAAVAAWLEARGASVTIVNPTPYPEPFRFLLHRPDVIMDADSPGAREAIEQADLILVLDTSEPGRIAPVGDWLDPARTWVVDHHPAGREVVGQGGVQDPGAAATGELVYDMMTLARDSWTPTIALATYVAIVGDTGSFRFGNTTPRTHAIAACLMQLDVDPEDVFRRLYAVAPPRRLKLLREALATLQHDPEAGIAWMVIPFEVTQRLGVDSDDFDGLIDQARSIQGTEVAIMFRETEPGRVKVSLRSSGDADVNRVARQFGGGGHVKASGATLETTPEEAVERVVGAVREELGGEH